MAYQFVYPFIGIASLDNGFSIWSDVSGGLRPGFVSEGEERQSAAAASRIALIVSSAFPSRRLCRLQPYAARMGWRRTFRSIPPFTRFQRAA